MGAQMLTFELNAFKRRDQALAFSIQRLSPGFTRLFCRFILLSQRLIEQSDSFFQTAQLCRVLLVPNQCVGPWHFIGPIAIWFLVMGLNPQGLADFMNSGSHPDGFLAGLAEGMGTKAGITALWAHVVAGDIAVTRWIWQDSLKRAARPWATRIAVFFGVMMMPLGLALHLLLRSGKLRG